VKKYFAFIAVGSFFADVEEFLTVLVLRRDIGSFIFTIAILFPVFLTMVFFSSKLLDRLFARDWQREMAHLLVYGWVGLLMEWFLMGHPPWNIPEARPIWILAMLGFQTGMASFWSAVSFAPRMFVAERPLSRNVGRQILRFYVPYFVVVYVVGLAAPTEMKFGIIIPTVIVAYMALNAFFAYYFRQAIAQELQACQTGDSMP
jgi:hypothetical protein